MKVKKALQRFTQRSEFYLFIVFVVICIAIHFITGGMLFAPIAMITIVRSMIILGMFALINMMVVVSGGFDLSFAALAGFAHSAAVAILLRFGWGTESIWSAFLIAGGIGLLLGMLNGFIISKFKLNTMIVTLGTQTLFFGLSLGVFMFVEVPPRDLPMPLRDFGVSYLFDFVNEAGLRAIMPMAVIPFIFLAILVWFIMNKTMFGRSLYAIGGNEMSAERAGINVKRTKFLLYCFVGLIAGMIGMLRVTLAGQSIPMGFMGWDLMVIPAVILGGASIFGGAGSVFGTVTAVALVSVVTNSLLLMRISTAWSDLVYGLVILAGVTISAIQVRRRQKRGLQ